jgi:type II secretory pathway predicted ATPase ExeA
MNHAAFAKFLLDYKIGVRAFADYSGFVFISKSTVQRLRKPTKTETVSEAEKQKILPAIMDACRRLMEERGTPYEEIENTMTSIFEQQYQPAATDRKSLTDAEQDYFKLRRDPFAIGSDPREAGEVFISEPLQRIVERVTSAINYQEFIAILGPVGAGKSSLKQYINVQLRQGNSKVHFIHPKFAEMGRVDAAGIVSYILDHFDLKEKRRNMVSQRKLERHLQGLVENRQRIAIVFDEAHRLNNTTLSALKNFLEMGTGGFQRFLSVVLYGQPSFYAKLNLAPFREIAERLVILEMPSMNDTVSQYIDHRLQLVSDRRAADLFEPASIELIASRGKTPLAIGNLANGGLSAAYKKGDHKVTVRHLGLDNEPKTQKLSRVK